jgi:hypothetical protein
MSDWLEKLRTLKHQSETHPDEIVRALFREYYDLYMRDLNEIFQSMPQEQKPNEQLENKHD